ncbi:MAG: BBE domain-containing protein [Stellaceae bacterium]
MDGARQPAVAGKEALVVVDVLRHSSRTRLARTRAAGRIAYEPQARPHLGGDGAASLHLRVRFAGPAFWGRNYPRLQAVKARYDPDGLFFVHHGVGSEDWSADGFTRI